MTEPKKKPVKKAPAKKAPAKKAVAKPPAKPVVKKAFIAPVKHPVITCPYGRRGNVWICGYHTGVDYAAALGTPVYAVADGKYLPGNWGGAYGIHQIIQHGTHRYLYGHLRQKITFRAGEHIKQGQLIGYSGDTGSSKAGPHLHLEARVSPYRYALDAVEPTSALK